MSNVLNMKHALPERLHYLYIDQETIATGRHPFDQRAMDISSVAHILVSERHGKFDLVHLVAHLMMELQDLKEKR